MVFKAEQTIDRPLNEVFDFFSCAENLQRITPSQLDFEILTPVPIEMKQGTLIEYKLKVRGLPMRWRTLIEVWEPPHRFVDLQLKGPYKVWHHTHEFEALPDGRTLMKDTVNYEVPFGVLGRIADLLLVSSDIRRIFEFRKSEIERLFAAKT